MKAEGKVVERMASADRPGRSGVAGIERLWRTDRPLTAVGVLMTAAAGAFAAGLALDPSTIAGAPAWLKPFKFAVSTAVYSLTLAWLFAYLQDWPRVRRVVGWTTAIVFVMEVAIIAAQAWRGTTSHFNVSTPLNAALFNLMGAGILAQTAASVAVAVALWKQPFTDASFGWALRLGMALTLAGAMTGPLMTRATPEQLAALRAGAAVPIVGAHSVGGVDGGPGVPVTGWSREHGDLRVAHFVGLHGIQAFALLAVALRRSRRSARVRVIAVGAAAASYAALFGLALWQALRGDSVVRVDGGALPVLGAWMVITLAVVGGIAFGRDRNLRQIPLSGPGAAPRTLSDTR